MEYLKSVLGYGKMSPDLKKAIKRLEHDRQELMKSPVANVSAAPLDSNMLEWHCNIQHQNNIYHIILFFPKEYPCVSPSAEFVPSGFNFRGGAYMPGKKGTKICLSIFSDFADIHTEWANEENSGWSPGYTVQTVLLNLISFLAEIQNPGNSTDHYHRMCRKFVCSDCGHTFQKPYPPLEEERVIEDIKPTENKDSDAKPEEVDDHGEKLESRIVDYFSKETFSIKKSDSSESEEQQMFGYGLIVSGTAAKPMLRTPCEYVRLSSFRQMELSLGHALSVNKEKLSFFLPLYINDQHGRNIQQEFEKTLRNIAPTFHLDFESSMEDVILEVIPNLMCSAIVQFSKGTVHTSDNSLEGYFTLHRLFLWAMDTYPVLRREVDKRLGNFVTNPKSRNKIVCPDIGKWLMLLSVCGKYTWVNVAPAYLEENFKRNVMWYLKANPKLGDMNTPMDYRLQHTFELTQVGRDLLAFQVSFLRIAKPPGMSRGDVLRRYESNLGLPSNEMVQELKSVFNRINEEVKRYDQWYNVIGVPVPTKAQLHETLMASIKFAKSTKGYHFTNRR